MAFCFYGFHLKDNRLATKTTKLQRQLRHKTTYPPSTRKDFYLSFYTFKLFFFFLPIKFRCFYFHFLRSHFPLTLCFCVAVSVVWFQPNKDHSAKAVTDGTMLQTANTYYSALLETVTTLFSHRMFFPKRPPDFGRSAAPLSVCCGMHGFAGFGPS